MDNYGSCLAYRLAMKRILALLICLGVAACTAAGASMPSANLYVLSIPERAWQTDAGDCIPELYAYAGVVNLAKQLGRDRKVFDDALTDLRDQLVDCLTDQEGDVLPIRQPGVSVERDVGRVIETR